MRARKAYRRRRRTGLPALACLGFTLWADSPAGAQPEPSRFHLSFRGPTREIQLGDLDVRIFTRATLEDVGPREERGPEGWTIDIGSRGCEIIWASTNETRAAPINIGGLRDGGFERTELVTVDGQVHARSTILLSSTGRVWLLPSGGAHDILQLAVEMPRREGEPCEACSLFYAIREGGERAPVIIVEGETFQPAAEEADYELCPVPFRRGDVNTDGRIDISDPIRIVMFLFLGQSYIPCNDTADTNDSGEVDISDAIHALLDLFRPETSIPPPGPAGCGSDPTPERIDCEVYAAC